MKVTFIYSSRSGNTKKLAEGLYNLCNIDKEIYNIDEYKENESDIYVVCCWIDKANPDNKSMDIVELLNNKKIYILATLGASPKSQHGQDCINNIKNIYIKGNIIGIDLVQGAISDEMIQMFKKLPVNHSHSLNEEKLKKYEALKGRPNQNDIEEAYKKMIKEIEKVN